MVSTRERARLATDPAEPLVCIDAEQTQGRALPGASIEEIAHRLHVAFGEPDLGNKDDPLDELVFIVLTTMTTDKSAQRVYEAFRRRFPRWEDVEQAAAEDVRFAIADAGLSHQKAPHIRAILRRIRHDFGTLSLMPLATWSDEAAERYLMSLPGVGRKTARCVLMFSMGRAVFPVDTHVQRIMNRLGVVQKPIGRAAGHDTFQAVVPPPLRHALHVNMVLHGRTLCTALRPRCGCCPLLDICAFGRQARIDDEVLQHDNGVPAASGQ